MCHASKLVHENPSIDSSTMSFHPTGVAVEIVGTTMSSNGRSYGSVLNLTLQERANKCTESFAKYSSCF